MQSSNAAVLRRSRKVRAVANRKLLAQIAWGMYLGGYALLVYTLRGGAVLNCRG
jgi:hypothetical protein